jgi:hypothetical protein
VLFCGRSAKVFASPLSQANAVPDNSMVARIMVMLAIVFLVLDVNVKFIAWSLILFS